MHNAEDVWFFFLPPLGFSGSVTCQQQNANANCFFACCGMGILGEDQYLCCFDTPDDSLRL